PNAWADYDGDGDLDLFVGMRYGPNHLYRNDDGRFTDVAPEAGLADAQDTRAAAWGDYDADGDPDLYVGFPAEVGEGNRLYRNDGGRFTDVAGEKGVGLVGTTRQPSWVDYDGDGDLDLFVAMRDQPNRLFRNDGDGPFTDVTEVAGVGDPRRTVGVVWFDYDHDGDLDVHISNQNGDEDAFLQNQGDGSFVDVAPDLGMNWPGRGEEYGSVAPAVADYDNDGDLDLFIAAYGPDVLWSNNGDGTFDNVTDPETLGQDYHSTTAAWADFDHDGRPDLLVTSYLGDVAEAEDHLFLNRASGFENVIPANLLEHGPSHGVAWADYDGDGDLDLAIANNNQAAGTHHLYRNDLPPSVARRSIQVSVVDSRGSWMFPGAEVRVRDGESGALLGSRLIDSGGGYCSQGMAPAHFGLPEGSGVVDVEVTVIRGGERVLVTVTGIDVGTQTARPLVVEVP
ncbi:MAG: CRTAC1 family protein, partial [Gemmatimonadetes bacterium]|nr:CRTAC1 family protein [Gemmatimonadota bacterium]